MKLLTLFDIYISSETTNFQMYLFLKSNTEVEDSLFYF